MFDHAGGGMLYVLGGDGLPPYQREDPIEIVRYSREAEHLLQSAELTSKRRKKRIDMLAAQIMLSGYLESQTKGDSQPGALDD